MAARRYTDPEFRPAWIERMGEQGYVLHERSRRQQSWFYIFTAASTVITLGVVFVSPIAGMDLLLLIVLVDLYFIVAVYRSTKKCTEAIYRHTGVNMKVYRRAIREWQMVNIPMFDDWLAKGYAAMSEAESRRVQSQP